MKIAFLFLTVANIAHVSHWQDFFTGHEEHYSIVVHAKNPLSIDSWFKQYEMPYVVPTSWARTMRAQIALLKQALADPDNGMFVFASELTIPLTDFQTVYDTLTAYDKSYFYFEPNPHAVRNTTRYLPSPSRDLRPIGAHQQFKNAQWVILNRKHAQMMVDDRYYITIAEHYLSDQEHYPSTFLLSQGCFDEIIPLDMTYVEWNESSHPPYKFTDFSNPRQLQLMRTAINAGYLFARKIVPDCHCAPLDQFLCYRQK